MSKQRELKQQQVAEIKQKLQESVAAVLTDYRGLNVAQVTKLRTQLREAGVEYKVLKNTLTSLAAHELGLESLDAYLSGPTAIAFSHDPVAPAKVLFDFAKANKALEIKGGVLEGKVIDFNQVKALADLPSKEQLLAKVLGGMQAPLYGMAAVLNGPLRNFVYALEAIRKQKEAQA
ncbi:50S ribosomal protein L10 [Zhaonella formicivorans]|uniref:50S ribosomal protein L10 n=1 Tax=Zhaonella formicivorans TaxID=2528593 RepID=UPI0010DDC67E|nr:50S ribosomal protein L10 [Zhaonella formicivorans]